MRLLLVGYGRMGQLVESLCPEYGCAVAGVIDRSRAGLPDEWPAADVAIDFSTADAVPSNFARLAARVFGLPESLIKPVPNATFVSPTPRPRSSSLRTDKVRALGVTALCGAEAGLRGMLALRGEWEAYARERLPKA